MLFILLVMFLFMLGYAWIDHRLLCGLSRLKKGHNTKAYSVSVLVCARNEEKLIRGCLDSILAQRDLPKKMEIWVANDRSTDKTGRILEEYAHRYPEIFHVLELKNAPEGKSPKKHAITLLHDRIEGDIVLVTDADCRVPPTWVRDILREFEEDVDMVLGHSEFGTPASQPGFFWGVQALEFLSHSIVSAGAAGMEFPITSTANNLAWRKDLFFELGGYEGVDHVLSGDDDFLLQKAAARNSGSIRYSTSHTTFVRTFPQKSWSGLWEQRKRWASKTPLYRRRTVLLLQFVFLYYSATLLCLLAGPFSFPVGALGIFSLLWKSSWDFSVMRRGSLIFGKRGYLRWFVPTALSHLPLIVGAVLFGTLGSFHWKGSKG